MLRLLGPVLRNVVVADPSSPPAPPTPPTLKPPIAFGDPATAPGGVVNLVVLPPAEGLSERPTALSAYFAPTALALPPEAELTADWLHANVSLRASVPLAADATGAQITVPGVTPGIYDVYTVAD